MNPRLRIAAIVLGLAAVIWVLYLTANRLYLHDRAALVQQIGAASAQVASYRSAKDDQKRVNAELRGYVDRTLGGDRETVDHMLRTRLNRLAEHVQLQNKSVETAPSSKVKESPAKMAFNRSGIQKPLRDEPDFAEINGWITGTASFEQVLRLVDSIESEPWIKRIDKLTLTPTPKDNGTRFDVNVRLTTLFLPQRTPNPENAAAANASGLDRYAMLAKINPFRVPPPPPPPPDPKPQPMTDPPPATAPAFPYEQWTITGVAQSPAGAEIWLLNQQTRESRRLGVGESLQDIILVAATGENAQFRFGERLFNVVVGRNLSDRTPVNQ